MGTDKKPRKQKPKDNSVLPASMMGPRAKDGCWCAVVALAAISGPLIGLARGIRELIS